MLRELNTSLFIVLPFLFLSQVKDSAVFFGDKPINPYYYSGRPINPHYDFYAVKKIYHQHIDSLCKASNFTGIITITFFINYLGQADFFSLKAVDDNYKVIPLSQHTNSSLYNFGNVILRTTQRYFNSWTVGTDKDGQPVNFRKFYSFRFTNGILSDILPK